jgi:beta-phosphoglucomutase-like phosphatase (HAD superfamily)
MPRPESKRVNRDQYDAVLFDLDGVITNTATLHATCWKQMFDEYLRERAEQKGEAFRPFDLATDYRLYVDGEPRFDGVRDFLRSRRIQLPEGTSDDPADVETVHGLGNRKNELVNRAIAELGALHAQRPCCRHASASRSQPPASSERLADKHRRLA